MKRAPQNSKDKKLNKGKFNKKQIEHLKAKYEMITEKNVLMLNQIKSLK